MEFDIVPAIEDAVNVGIAFLINRVPGGSAALATSCDGLELACKMGLAVAPRLRDGKLTTSEFEEIVTTFKEGVPGATWTVAMSILRSAFDRTIGSLR
jgi:hypothetical protein